MRPLIEVRRSLSNKPLQLSFTHFRPKTHAAAPRTGPRLSSFRSHPPNRDGNISGRGSGRVRKMGGGRVNGGRGSGKWVVGEGQENWVVDEGQENGRRYSLFYSVGHFFQVCSPN